MVKTAVGTDDSDGAWMSTSQAAGYLGITLRMVYRLIDEGQLRAYRIGRVFRIREADVFELRLRLQDSE